MSMLELLINALNLFYYIEPVNIVHYYVVLTQTLQL